MPRMSGAAFEAFSDIACAGAIVPVDHLECGPAQRLKKASAQPYVGIHNSANVIKWQLFYAVQVQVFGRLTVC